MTKLIAKNFSRLCTSLLLALSLIQTSFAQAVCKINGEEVPCSDFFNHPIFSWGIGILVVILLLAIAGFVLWVAMLVHAINQPIENKALWIILMVAIGPVASIVYYFAVKRPLSKNTPTKTQ